MYKAQKSPCISLTSCGMFLSLRKGGFLRRKPPQDKVWFGSGWCCCASQGGYIQARLALGFLFCNKSATETCPFFGSTLCPGNCLSVDPLPWFNLFRLRAWCKLQWRERAFPWANHACTSKFGLTCGIDLPTFYRIDLVQAFLVSSAVAADVPIPTDLSLSGMSRSWPAETCNSLYFAHLLSACLEHREHVGTTSTKRIFKPIFLDKFNVVTQGLCCCITNWIKTFLLPQQVLSLIFTRLREQISDGCMCSILFPKAFQTQ